MAKRKKSKKSGRKSRSRCKSRGIGSIINMRTLGGLGMVESSTFMPMLLGGGIVGAVVALVRRILPLDTGSANNRTLVKYAPVLGVGAGILAGFGYASFVTKRKSDSGLAAASALIVGGSLMANDFLVIGPKGGAVATALGGIGAIVPELGRFGGVTVLEPWTHNNRPDSLGAIVPELSGIGSAGETLSFAGIDTSVFGTSAYSA